ncbi:hypothetical protein D3C85_1660000 [compost metagenome]
MLYASKFKPLGYQINPRTCTIQVGSLKEAISTYRNGYRVTRDSRINNKVFAVSKMRSPQLLLMMIAASFYQSLLSLVRRLNVLARTSSVKFMRELKSPTAEL